MSRDLLVQFSAGSRIISEHGPMAIVTLADGQRITPPPVSRFCLRRAPPGVLV